MGGRAQPHPREQPSLLGRIPTKTAAKRPERRTRAPVWLRRVRALPVLLACLARERGMVRTVRLSAEVRSSESPAPAKTKPFGCSIKKSTTTSGNSFTIRPRIRAAFSALRTSHHCKGEPQARRAFPVQPPQPAESADRAHQAASPDNLAQACSPDNRHNRGRKLRKCHQTNNDVF